MQFSLSFKTPNVSEQALEDVHSEHVQEDIKDFLSTFIEYDECITIDFDTQTGTATVRSTT